MTINKIDEYTVIVDSVKANILISSMPHEYVPIYTVVLPKIETATEAVLSQVREKLVETVKVSVSEILDIKAVQEIKSRFLEQALRIMEKQFPSLSVEQKKSLAGRLIHDMLGLGPLEILLADPNLEEVVVNGSNKAAWVYHKTHGWLKTNIVIPTEDQIYNYASVVGRKVGRQITNLSPLMDAHLPSGDRVNATLFPVSTLGNTLTIRKFAREPWTVVHLISPEENTMSKELASLIWLCMEYELNILVGGGTASGKTSVLNAIAPFIPPNHRILSIEDTRELLLPEFLHWVALTTREPNPEGKGEVNMLDLMINGLRMRPDRVIVGEIRRSQEAEILFEAMHTGHSVYSTLHADSVDQAKRRLINPPISLPEEVLEALHLIIVQYRHRRLRIRRTFEVAEINPKVTEDGKVTVDMDLLYRWNPKTDKLMKVNDSIHLYDQINLHTGMNIKEINENLKEKQDILQWMLDNRVYALNDVGKVMADYYGDKQLVLEAVKGGKTPSFLLG